MKCPKCQFENRKEAVFCRNCGASLAIDISCPNCQAANPPDSKFCEKCGRDLKPAKETPPPRYSEPQSYTPKFLADKILTTRSAMAGERKVVTVLFADVANYTGMSEKLEPEEVHQIMDGCFKILMDEIHHYEGTINQFTGDGIMALFGAPVAHEDHAQRACRAALAIQKAMSGYGQKIEKECDIEFKLRIGLNSGPVIVGSIGDDLRMDYTAVGDTTNLASRMQVLARQGSVFVSNNTFKLAGEFFEFDSLGKLAVKGKQEPVEAYELIRAGEIETRIEAAAVKGLTRFVGRKNAVVALKEVWDRVKSGAGQVVGMVGEAGVGKTRLLLEFRTRLPQDQFAYLEGRCLHYGSSMAYLPILDILRSFFEIKKEDRDFIIQKKMKDRLLDLDERLANILPPLQDLLSLKVEDKGYLQLEPGEKKLRIFEAIRDLLIREAQRRPLIVAVDDLHWIDKTSQECLGYLIEWLANTRILLVLLYRPEYTHQWGNKSYYSRIGVEQLNIQASAELVQAILADGKVVSELSELILSKAGGNPLFVEELTHSLLENGSIHRKDSQYVLARKTSEIDVPESIQGIVAARMDRLEENLKRIMQVASVIGREFAFRILQTIMGMRQELKSHLLNLQGLEFIYEKSLFPELEYIFKHALTQEVAYNSLLQKRRQEIHARIGQAIESLYAERLEEFYEALAFHYARSDNKVKAIEYLDMASQKAVELCAAEEALAYFEEAMKLLDELPDDAANQKRRISLLVNQWAAFYLLFRQTEYYDLLTRYEPVAVGLGKPEILGPFYACLGSCQWWFGLLGQSVRTLAEAARLCEAAGDVERAGNVMMSLQWSYLWMGDYNKVIALKKDVLRLLDMAFNSRTHVLSLAGTSMAYTQMGQWDLAKKDGHEGLKVAGEYSNNSLASFAAFAIALAHSSENNPGQALDFAELAVRKAPTVADKVFSQSGLSWALCRSGQASKGVALGTELIPMFEAVRFVPGEIWETAILAEGFFLTGEYAKATQTIEKALELARRCEMKFFIGWAYRLQGEIALKTNPAQTGDPLAAPCFEKSIAILGEIKAENELALAHAGYGRLYKQQGEITQARQYLTQALEIFERLGTLTEPDRVRAELAELRED
jgi:class 3 adenylate cyclase/tetratricopeptide (TPR) repeat protein